MKNPSPAIKQRPSRWRDTVLICRKCTRKLGGGFGPRHRRSLRKTLIKALALKKGRKASIGVVEVGCFDLCPKRAVTVSCGSRPERLYVIPRSAAIAEVIAALGLPQQLDVPSPPPD